MRERIGVVHDMLELGPFHSKARSLSWAIAVTLQPMVLSFCLSSGFQNSSYFPLTQGSTSAKGENQSTTRSLCVNI